MTRDDMTRDDMTRDDDPRRPGTRTRERRSAASARSRGGDAADRRSYETIRATESVVALLGEPLARRLDLGLGLVATDPVGALDRLAGLQVLVDLEEVLDLQAVELGDVVDVTKVLHPRV